MTTLRSTDTYALRLWPGVVAAALCVAGFASPVVAPDIGPLGMIVALAGGLAIILWWLFFSRAPWPERIGAVVLMALGVAGTSRVIHESIAGAGMGMLFPILSIPLLSIFLVIWAVTCRGLSSGPRRTAMVVAILLGCGGWMLLRTEGIRGEGGSQFAWRWTPTAEERLLAEARPLPAALPAPPPVATAPSMPEVAKESPAAAKVSEEVKPEADKIAPPMPAPEWPGFRGPNRDSIVSGLKIETDWTASPPVELWRRAIGPGWSSFAVQGDLIYTQEQRGPDEVVACYKLSSGEPVWGHRDPARFYESNGGPGPRGTPALHNGRVYTFGATGILNVLDALTGAIVWSRNAASDTGEQIPDWGFASSPLIVDDVVVVATAGKLAGYEIATGKPRWIGKRRGGGYSSPHLITVDGVPQIILLSGAGATSVSPADGAVLWEYDYTGAIILQPAVMPDGDLLLAAASAMGGESIRRLGVQRTASGWTVAERWTSRGLKPYFNDFVVHENHAYGFDGSILAAIDLKDGARKWKGGRYGNGQLVLLPDQDLLLILSEGGELAIVSATPDKFTEIARMPAIEGKTWNHPVLVGDTLLVRNDREMAAFRMSRSNSVP